MRRSIYILFAILMVDYMLAAGEINSQGRSAVEFDIREELDERLNLFENAVKFNLCIDVDYTEQDLV